MEGPAFSIQLRQGFFFSLDEQAGKISPAFRGGACHSRQREKGGLGMVVVVRMYTST